MNPFYVTVYQTVLIRGLVLHCLGATTKCQPIGAMCIFGSQFIFGRSFGLLESTIGLPYLEN